MPVLKVRTSTHPEKGESLVRKVTERTSDLLTQSDRVLVVYGKQSASIYYEGSELPRLSRNS